MSDDQDENLLVDHLFRHESGRMIAALTRFFGFERLEIAEDLVQDTFIQAVETWKIKGPPENPQAWLYRVAKNKATDYVRRQQTKRRIDKEIRTAIPVEYSIAAHVEQAFQTIRDSQLQMLFAVCHPSIPSDAQIAMALKTLGGFGIQEIANAFLTNKENINKRLYRAREKLRAENIHLAIPPPDQLTNRLDRVLQVIYLMFNEGYYSKSDEAVLRKELCLEAMRLCLLLTQAEMTNTQNVKAVMALMCFHTSRFESRLTEGGELVPWEDQDRSKWNKELIQKGLQYLGALDMTALGTRFQIEAVIAYYHTLDDHAEKWQGLLSLYTKLAKLTSNPLIHLSIAFVISKVNDVQDALDYLDENQLPDSYLFYSLRGDLLSKTDSHRGIEQLQMAMDLAPLQTEKNLLKRKIEKLKEK